MGCDSTLGACLGTSTPVAYIESASDIAEGGRTGLAFGFMSYVLIKIFTGKHKDIPVPMYVISFLFIVLFAIQ